MKHTYVPRAAFVPEAQAAGMPEFRSWRTQATASPWSCRTRSTAHSVPSVLPSSTNTTSVGMAASLVAVRRRSASTSTFASSLKQGTTTLSTYWSAIVLLHPPPHARQPVLEGRGRHPAEGLLRPAHVADAGRPRRPVGRALHRVALEAGDREHRLRQRVDRHACTGADVAQQAVAIFLAQAHEGVHHVVDVHVVQDLLAVA